jgi:hypothetical protein
LQENNKEERQANSNVHIVINLGIPKTNVFSLLDILQVGKAEQRLQILRDRTKTSKGNQNMFHPTMPLQGQVSLRVKVLISLKNSMNSSCPYCPLLIRI